MEKQLYPGMYLWGSKLFGISNDQKNSKNRGSFRKEKEPAVIGDWYDATGAFLGHGYLWVEDFETISHEIAPGKAFIVVPKKLFLGSVDKELEGLSYVLEYMQWVILRGAIYFVSRAFSGKCSDKKTQQDGVGWWLASEHFVKEKVREAIEE